MKRILMGLLLGLSLPISAGQLTEPPPLKPELLDVYLYLKQVERNFNNPPVVTSNPDGSKRSRVGDTVLYNNGGSWKECNNTDGATTWRCEANARTAP